MQTLELEAATLMFDGLVLEVFNSAGSHRFLPSRLDVPNPRRSQGHLLVTLRPGGGQAIGFGVPAESRAAFDAFMAGVQPA